MRDGTCTSGCPVPYVWCLGCVFEIFTHLSLRTRSFHDLRYRIQRQGARNTTSTSPTKASVDEEVKKFGTEHTSLRRELSDWITMEPPPRPPKVSSRGTLQAQSTLVSALEVANRRGRWNQRNQRRVRRANKKKHTLIVTHPPLELVEHAAAAGGAGGSGRAAGGGGRGGSAAAGTSKTDRTHTYDSLDDDEFSVDSDMIDSKDARELMGPELAHYLRKQYDKLHLAEAVRKHKCRIYVQRPLLSRVIP